MFDQEILFYSSFLDIFSYLFRERETIHISVVWMNGAPFWILVLIILTFVADAIAPVCPSGTTILGYGVNGFPPIFVTPAARNNDNRCKSHLKPAKHHSNNHLIISDE